jgi:hypothetical protein
VNFKKNLMACGINNLVSPLLPPCQELPTMTVEKLDNNDQTSPAEEKPTPTASRAKTTPRAAKEKEVVALSLKDNSEETNKAIKLIQPADALPNNRPIEAGHLKVVSTYTSVGGERPVTASGMEVSGTLAISGNRPIAVSHLKISETYSVMGNRPVASNEVDDAMTLMGFLD